MNKDKKIELLYIDKGLPLDDFLSCYEGLNTDFLEYWKKEKGQYYHEDMWKKEMEKAWIDLLDWVEEFTRLLREPFYDKDGQFRGCCAETQQEYISFSYQDILLVLINLGKAANMLYLADRDYFISNYLHKYYVLSQEELTNLVATFVQEVQSETDFTDLVTRLDIHARRHDFDIDIDLKKENNKVWYRFFRNKKELAGKNLGGIGRKW